MSRRLPLAALLAVTGCTGPRRIEVNTYTELGRLKHIKVADPVTVDENCYSEYGHEDDGMPSKWRNREVAWYANGRRYSYMEYDRVRACFDGVDSIWLTKNATLKTILHELCHAGTRLTKKECKRRYPTD